MGLSFSEYDDTDGTIIDSVYFYDIDTSTATSLDITMKYYRGVLNLPSSIGGEYYVTYTDYTNFATLYMCNDALGNPPTVYVLTREAEPVDIDEFSKTIKKGIINSAKYFNPSWLVDVVQGTANGCVYA